MTYAREKRLLLGVAALGVGVPLPLNQMLEWPVLALFVLAVALFLRRAWGGAERWLSNRALNLLGLAYLPVLALDIASTGRAQLLRPILHLTLFGVAAKLWSIREEKHKWQAWIGIFFLFLAAMATSVHPAVTIYLAAYLVVAVVLMLRFVYLHMLAGFGHRQGAPPVLPVRRLLAAMILATLVLAVPLFAMLPRVRSPYILGPGGGLGQETARAGFSDEMSLDLIGRIRDNREVALHLFFAGEPSPPGVMRFKAATYDIWEGRSWQRSGRLRTLVRSPRDGVFRLVPGRPKATVDVVLEPLRSKSFILPTEALTVDSDLVALDLDRGGAVSLKGAPGEPIEYRVELGSEERSLAAPPEPELQDPALDPRGVSDRIARLAAEWAGVGDDEQRARRIERRLIFGYDYTLDLVGRGGEDPIEHFLFTARRGHCEYFATAMVLLLRAQGIPARLVTGFLGAEYSVWERSWIVRQSNAHAWVEAWIPGQGWLPFDPTPPAGRPQPEPENLVRLARQGYEFLVFRWDRYVLSFDFNDQVGLFFSLRSAWDQLMRGLAGGGAGETGAPSVSAAAPAAPATAPLPTLRRLAWPLGLSGGALLAALGAWLAWRQRSAWSATRAYLELRRALGANHLPVPDWLGPLAFAELAGRRLPEAGAATSRLVTSYLRESFAGRPCSPAELARLRDDLRSVEAVLRAARRKVR